MPERLTILFAPMDGVGHVNACIGLAELLKERGHRIVFAINESWKGRLTKYGFEEELMKDPNRDPNIDPAQYWAQVLQHVGGMMALPPMEKMKLMTSSGMMSQFIEQAKRDDPIYKEIVDKYEPNVIVIDGMVCYPSLVYSGTPWVWSVSLNPLFCIDHENTPPPGFGFPSNGDRNEWKELKETMKGWTQDIWKQYNDYIMSLGHPALPPSRLMCPSTYLNIYGYPEEIDYTDLRVLPPNWQRFDSFKREEKHENFEIPSKLRAKSGKLIYFSLGSMGSANVELMKRLVSILSKSQHKFIVSKGPLSNQYELAHNMWGEKTVPQVQVLPLVDLVITHGGNNTVTETLFYGKPMIVLPLFGDQYDNAQRIQETGYGLRLDPHNCTALELLEGIEYLLNNNQILAKLENMSKRIQSSKSLEKVIDSIEGLVKQNGYQNGYQ